MAKKIIFSIIFVVDPILHTWLNIFCIHNSHFSVKRAFKRREEIHQNICFIS